ncbi:MAG: chemotaxis protein CheW [Cyanobacteria bacterium J06600_6]
MGIKPYLIFKLHDVRYAIAAEFVTEIFLLPELTVVPEAPPDVVGLLNLHSKYVPVMHLDLRFGHKFDRCNVSDSVIVIESQDTQIGLIVHRVETVSEIDDRYIQADLTYGRELNIHQAFVQSVINLDDEMITLLNVDNLVRHPDALAELMAAEHETEAQASNFFERYFADTNSNTRDILHRRAVNLKEVKEDTAEIALMPLAVVSIAERYFALDLATVREFTHITRVTSVPCCPNHIIGNINLRGEILTLIDLVQPLNLEVLQHQPTKAVVVEVDDITAGIVVQEVHDVIDFPTADLKPVPVAMNAKTGSFLKGLAEYQNQTLNVVDLPRLFREGAMTVELTV